MIKEDLTDSKKIDYIYKRLKRQMFFYYLNLILKLIIILTLFFYWYKVISNISLDSLIKNQINNELNSKSWLNINDLNKSLSGWIISPDLMKELNNMLNIK